MLFPASRAEDMALLPSHPEWQSIFDTYGVLPRHMSQLYEMVLEGIVLFAEGVHAGRHAINRFCPDADAGYAPPTA
jgi:prolipoprotein diacylglyceryltransferase